MYAVNKRPGKVGMGMYPVREPGNGYVPSQGSLGMGMYPVKGAWEWVCTQSREPGNGYVPSQGSLGMSMYPVKGAWE